MNLLNVSGDGRILFQNEACMVINKLAGESSEFPGTNAAGEEKLFPVHRLDVPVTGCLLLARNPAAAAFLGDAFSGHAGECKVEKRYWAVVEKPPEANAVLEEAELVHWLYEDRKANKSFVLPWQENPPPPGERRGRPKKAILRYRMTGQGERYLFFEIDLVTGRHHQIRAQLAAMGFHIKGDLKYGARRSEKGGGIRLHAFSLAFPNPLNHDEIIRVEALPPLASSHSPDPLWTAFGDTVSAVHG